MQPREATRTQSGDQREAIQHTAGITTRFKNRLAQLATKKEGVRREFGHTDAASQNFTSGTNIGVPCFYSIQNPFQLGLIS